MNTKSEAAVTNTTEKDKKMKAPDPGNAHLRIGIRKAIMEGNTEDALELVRQNYPSPWFSGPSGGITFTNPNSKYDNSRMSYFMLRLQCFYEMVREHMRVRHLPTKQIGNGKAPDANGSEEWFDEVMKDVDSLNNGAGAEDTGSLMDMDASITSLKSNGTNGKVRATVSDTISMNDVDGDSDTPDNSYVTVESRFNESITEEDRKMQLAALDAKMLDYAKELKKDFGGNGDQIDVMLTSAYALFAYPEPEKVEHLSEMLSDKQRESVAESVNAAILSK